ncbi:MAG: type II secretion system protein GspG [Kiritimatiellae bacterium]|nr:type II secretion system protein GspG [Kiritimatiellia bacterium]
MNRRRRRGAGGGFARMFGRRLAGRGRDGFTLVEIMLVVVIIGILAGLAVTRFTGRTEDARRNAAKAEIARIKTAVDLYEVDNGKFPSSLGELVPKYLDKAPKDPWGNDYIYNSGDGTISCSKLSE